MAQSTQDKVADRPPFTALLADLAKGRINTRLGDELAALVAAVTETGKPGTLTLQLAVKVDGKGDEAIRITPKIANKVPVMDAPSSVFFVGDDGALSRNPQRQQPLFGDDADGGRD